MKLPGCIKRVYVLCSADNGECRECPLLKLFEDDINGFRIVCFRSIDDLIDELMDYAGYVEVRRSVA